MLFKAKFHRLTSTKWFYRSIPVELSDFQAISKRLDDLNAVRHIPLGDPDFMLKNDTVYLKMHRAGGWGVAEYCEFVIRLRRGAAQYNLAYGNSLITPPTKIGNNGFVNLLSPQLILRAQCSIELGRKAMGSSEGESKVAWSLVESADIYKSSAGTVLVQRPNDSIDLTLQFPSPMNEDGRISEIYIRNGGKILAVAIQSLNPMFKKGYRIALWLKNEVPVLYVHETFPVDSLTWSGILAALTGIICLYKPLNSSGG